MDNTTGNFKISLRPQSEIICAVLAGFGIWIKPRLSTDSQQTAKHLSKTVLHRAQPSHQWTCKR